MIDTPVLFLTFKRPKYAARVFESIRLAQPPRLYFASNAAPREDQESAEEVELVRKLLTKVDWPCHVDTLLRDQHLPVDESLVGAISWFFSNETEGIILEDDCLPHPQFFQFCEELLVRYRDDENVAGIGGTRIIGGTSIDSHSYYFSRYLQIWGWATWRRTWLDYDPTMSFWPEFKKSRSWREKNSNLAERIFWEKKFDATYKRAIRTWDYQLLAGMWAQNQLAISPSVNLVANIGFGADATFTRNPTHPLAEMPTFDVLPLQHPKDFAPDARADKHTFKVAYAGGHMSPLQRLRKAASLMLGTQSTTR